MSLTFLTPWGAIVALAAALPVAAAILGARRSERVRTALRLAAPGRERWALPVLALVPVLLALAATQPAIDHRGSQPTRKDASVFTVFDVSRSMLAASSPSARDAPCACPRSGDRAARSCPGAEVRRRDDDRPRRAAADADE